MRGLPIVLTVAFVFASGALLVGPASAQQSTEPGMPPEAYEQPPTDAVIQGRVTDGAGRPVAAASVSAYNYGPISYREGGEPSKEPAYYGGNSTTTDADGRFRLGVYSGENHLSVYREGYAQRSVSVPLEPGQTATQDLTVEKFPEKTARIEGKVTDARTGRGLQSASVYVSNPWYGTGECSMSESAGQEGGGSEPRPAGDAAASLVAPEFRGCSITVAEDGSYEGLVTPGYSIVSIHAYAPCDPVPAGQASSSDSCGPQYFSFSRTLSLPANATTTVNAALRSHDGPDAVVSGYLIDAETGQAIPGAQISFGNQESYGWGYATTDGDGSYRLRLRSGYHTVSVWAEGHLPWEGVLDVREGETAFDVRLTPGEAAYGGCCYAYATKGGVAMAEDAAVAPPSPNVSGAAGSSDRSASDGEGDDSGTTQQVLYEDLGGGLGPYDAAEREGAAASDDGLTESEGEGIPGAGLLLTLGAVALAAVAALRRRA